MGPTFPFWPTLFRERLSRPSSPIRNFGKVLWNNSAWNRDTSPQCGAGFSHWYHMALQLWIPLLICVGFCNCVQWTWNHVKNKRPIYRFFSLTCEKQDSHIWLSFSRGFCYKVNISFKWRKNLSPYGWEGGPFPQVMVELSTRSHFQWSHEWAGDELNGGGILGRDWEAQTASLPMRAGEECVHWAVGRWTWILSEVEEGRSSD